MASRFVAFLPRAVSAGMVQRSLLGGSTALRQMVAASASCRLIHCSTGLYASGKAPRGQKGSQGGGKKSSSNGNRGKGQQQSQQQRSQNQQQRSPNQQQRSPSQRQQQQQQQQQRPQQQRGPPSKKGAAPGEAAQPRHPRTRNIPYKQNPRQGRKGTRRKRRITEDTKPIYMQDTIRVSELVSAGELDEELVLSVVQDLHDENATLATEIDMEAAELIVDELDADVRFVRIDASEDVKPRTYTEKERAKWPAKPPVITIMGHVDHGKTTLLDAYRKSSIAAGEAGGITQHIGAFSVSLRGRPITFIDTPGHAAFANMRARGATATDVVILVVAADDGVMPQTVESIQHAKDAKVPIIVAVNKCDKKGADPELVRHDLHENGINVEDLGGDVPCVDVSALKQQGLDDLLENVLTVADLEDLRADKSGAPEAVVIEAKTDKFKGSVATTVIKLGTLRVGDVVIAGNAMAKVKALISEDGTRLKEATPGMAVEVMGWRDLPEPGSYLIGVPTEQKARAALEARANLDQLRQQQEAMRIVRERQKLIQQHIEEERKKSRNARLRVDELDLDVSDTPTLAVVVKGDVGGTVEAVVDAIKALPMGRVACVVSKSGVGNVTETDIQEAKAFDGQVIAFNVNCGKKEQNLADALGVPVKSYKVVYSLLDDLKASMLDKLPPQTVLKESGRASVLEIFRLTGRKKGVVAGTVVDSGIIFSNAKSCKYQLVRDGEVVYDGPLKSLKHFKQDVEEMTAGNECGIALQGHDDIQVGDTIICYVEQDVPPSLEALDASSAA